MSTRVTDIRKTKHTTTSNSRLQGERPDLLQTRYRSVQYIRDYCAMRLQHTLETGVILARPISNITKILYATSTHLTPQSHYIFILR